MYTCTKQECPNHIKQPLYCIMCNNDDTEPHDHKTKEISWQGDSYKDQWLNLRKAIATKIDPAKQWFETYEPLVKIMQSALKQGKKGKDQNNNLLQMFKDFFNLDAKIQQYYNQEVAEHEVADNLLKLKSCKPMFDMFTKELNNLMFLATIDSQMLWDYYGEFVEQASIDKVLQLTMPQVELFSILKLHSLALRVAQLQRNDQPQEKLLITKGRPDYKLKGTAQQLGLEISDFSMNCKSVSELARAESLRHELDAFNFMILAHKLTEKIEEIQNHTINVEERMNYFESIFS